MADGGGPRAGVDNRSSFTLSGSRITPVPWLNPDRPRAWAAVMRVAESQAGAVTRRQVLAQGLSDWDVRRALGTGMWTREHPGVFVAGAGAPRNGPAHLHTRMWAAHLALGGEGVVTGAAAGHYWGVLEGDLPPDEPVLLLVAEPHHAVTRGLRTRRIPDPTSRAHPARRPPVATVENAVLDLVSLADSDERAVELVLRACRERLTTPDRLLAEAADRARLRRRALLTELCAQVRAGITSPLERAYRSRVARPHGLPVGRAQVRSVDEGGVLYRDLLYDAQGVIVELDGRRGHEGEGAAFRDQRRDNSAALTGRATLRYGWVAVVGHSCEVAVQVTLLLTKRGWQGRARSCAPGCPIEGGGLWLP